MSDETSNARAMFFSSAKNACFCVLSSSAHRICAGRRTRTLDRRSATTITTTTTTTTTPMMKTKRAFLRNSIRGARTLVFSPPDSSGLPGREQLQAFLCFLGCLRRILLSSVAVAVVLRYSFCCVCLRFCVFAFLRARVYSFFAHRFVSSIFFFFIFIINDSNNAASERAFSFHRPKKLSLVH